jgi:hypothetical protein
VDEHVGFLLPAPADVADPGRRRSRRGFLLGKAGDLIEARRGPNNATKVLHTGRRWLQKRSTGPFASRTSADPAGVRDAGTPAR